MGNEVESDRELYGWLIRGFGADGVAMRPRPIRQVRQTPAQFAYHQPECQCPCYVPCLPVVVVTVVAPVAVVVPLATGTVTVTVVDSPSEGTMRVVGSNPVPVGVSHGDTV
jgi:hypothetical protein